MAGEDWRRRQEVAREKWVEVGGKRYLIRRPTDLEFRRMLVSGQAVGEELALRCVVGWDRVLEADLAPGVGGDAPVPFTGDVYREWIADRLDDLVALSGAILGEVKARRDQMEAVSGKSPSTSEP